MLSIYIDQSGYTYGGSFPVEKAFDGLGEVILAYEMNGEELPRDHGYPVRMLIPGHVGARQVKWLHKINLSNEESKKSYQCKSYRHFAPDITFEKGMSSGESSCAVMCGLGTQYSTCVLLHRPCRMASSTP